MQVFNVKNLKNWMGRCRLECVVKAWWQREGHADIRTNGSTRLAFKSTSSIQSIQAETNGSTRLAW